MKTTKGRNPPGIVKWGMFAGGTGESHGRHGYSWHTENGSYHIWPASRGDGSPCGYVLRFANQPKADDGGVWIGPGLWHDLGRHRSPAAAAKAAREHHKWIGRHDVAREQWDHNVN